MPRSIWKGAPPSNVVDLAALLKQSLGPRHGRAAAKKAPEKSSPKPPGEPAKTRAPAGKSARAAHAGHARQRA
jgi:hypothetical protein